MRKCLGVSVAVALLYAISWAQSPTQTPAPDAPPSPDSTTQAPATQQPTPPSPETPASQQPIQEPTSKPVPVPSPAPKYPLTELFVGYSFAQAGFFNAGHWAQLDGWDASFGLNAAHWLGFVFDASEYFGTSQIPTGAPAPFPNCPPFCPNGSSTFGADTREYNILFGAQFPYRKHELLTPFGEIMFGHDGVRGIAQALPPAGYWTEASSGLALLAGAGVDRKINERFAVRIKADYLQSKTSFPLIGKAKQDNIRVSVGIVIRSVKKKKRRLEDDTGVEQ